MPKVTVTIDIAETIVEYVVKSIMENMPECSVSMACTRWKYDKWEFTFIDENGPKEETYKLAKPKLLAAFPLLFSEEYRKCKGLVQPPASGKLEDWDEWLCQSDAGVFDAFVQLACLGKIIYG